MLTVRSTINIASQTVPPIIPVVQGDTGRAILFTLADFTIPAGATATYYVQKPSGEAVYNNATIDGNNVLVELTAQSIIEKGDNYGQVRITVGEEVVTSFDFILLVKEFRGIDAVQSLTEMNIFDKAVEQASEAIDEVKTDALEAIDDAKDEAIGEVTSNFDLKLDASSTKGVQNQVITQAINTVNNAIGDLSGETVTPTATNNYGVGGNVGQVIETWATTEYWHGIYTVSAGNTYGITTVSDFPQQLVVWFTNASNTIIENHKAFATDHVEMVCTAPTGATKLYVMSYGYDAYHGTVQKVEPLSETVSNLKDDFILSSEKLATTFYEYGTFARGGLNPDGTLLPAQYFRVSSTTHFAFDRDIYVKVASGYRTGYDKFENGTVTWSGWYTTDFIIPSGTEFVLQISTSPEDQSVHADVATYVNAVTLSTLTGNISSNVLMIDKWQLKSGSLQSVEFVTFPGKCWVTYLHKIPATPLSVVTVNPPQIEGVYWRYRFAWYDSTGAYIGQEPRTVNNYKVIPINARFLAFGFVAHDQNGNEMTSYNVLENLPENEIVEVKLGITSEKLAPMDAVIKWGYDSFIKKGVPSEKAGYSFSGDMIKHDIYADRLQGSLLCKQAFCIYNGKYYSVEEGKLGIQNADFSTVEEVSVNIGHGNNIQLGSSNLAYVNGTDYKVYVLNLDTKTVVDTISLPFSDGHATAVIDDINNIAYMLHSPTNGSGGGAKFTFYAYDLTNNETLYVRKYGFTVPLYQAVDFYDGKIIMIAGDNTNTNNRVYVFDLNATVIGEIVLNIFAEDEPEGVFFDRDTCELLVSGYSKRIFRLRHII